VYYESVTPISHILPFHYIRLLCICGVYCNVSLYFALSGELVTALGLLLKLQIKLVHFVDQQKTKNALWVLTFLAKRNATALFSLFCLVMYH